MTRVLVLTTYYHPVLGGVETHARQLVQHLRAAGADVQVVTKRVGRDDASDEVIDGARVHRVRPAGERRGAAKWLALPWFLGKIRSLRHTFDVIVCIDYRGIGIAAVVAGRWLDRPVILQAGTAGVLASTNADSAFRTGVPRESLLVRALKAPARQIYRRADRFVCIARDIEREVLEAGVPRDRVHYLPHGVDITRFRPANPTERLELRRRAGWPADRPVVLFVGRLSTEKGVLDLIEAWRLARPSALLVLVGPDMPSHPWDAGTRARRLVRDQGLEQSVWFAGPSHDTAPLYRAADVFVQPSQFEAFGISVIEAMASGVAVVASDVGGMRDFLVDGQNALLHPPRDPESTAAALTRALADGALRRRIAAAGLATARAEFDADALFTRYLAVIEATAARGAR